MVESVQQPAISVIVPVFNVAPYIEEGLDSLLAQDLEQDYEVILVDTDPAGGYPRSNPTSADFLARSGWTHELPAFCSFIPNGAQGGQTVVNPRCRDDNSSRLGIPGSQ